MTLCNAPSLAPHPSTYISRGAREQISTGGAHLCTREAGHTGPHTKETRMRLGETVAMRSRYIWDDEHTLRYLVDVVEVEPPPPDQMRIAIRANMNTAGTGP